jgi:predicted DNA binding CopG/RHH family protein
MNKDKSLRPKSPAGTPGNPVRIDTPVFQNEAEEAEWWDAHSELVTDLLIKYGRRPQVQTQSVTMRLPVQDLHRARQLAEKRGVGYQTLIKSLLHDVLKREVEKAS